MSKKNSNKREIRLLSPENYIRQRSRNLPLHKCWITEDWEETRLGSIIVSRKHASGKLTFCIYLVDLHCLGVKDTLYCYNNNGEALEKIFSDFAERDNKFVEISYELAHSIIYAAIDFAQKYGFKPHSDFRNITQYLLEENTENIPVIEVHCGYFDGKPMYMNTGDETPNEEKQILAQLTKTAGRGNFHYIVRDEKDGKFYENEAYDFEYEAIKEELLKLNVKKLKNRFLTVINSDEKSDTKTNTIIAMTEVLIPKILDDNKVDEYNKFFEKEFNIDIVETNDLPNSFFSGVRCKKQDKLFSAYEILLLSMEEAHGFEKELGKFRKIAGGDIPLISYLELLYHLRHIGENGYIEKLEQCYQKYPDYRVLKILWYSHIYSINKTMETREQFKNLIYDNAPVTKHELFIYLFNYIEICLLPADNLTLELLVAFEDTATSLLLPYDEHIARINEVLFYPQLMLLKNYCEEGK